MFLQRVCRGFETLVQNVMAKGQRETVLVTHAGVITGLLSAYGVPQAQPTQWMCQPGCGYSVRITPSLWMRSMVMEVYQTLPLGRTASSPTTWWWTSPGRPPAAPGARSSRKAKATLLTKPPARPIMPTKGKTVKGTRRRGAAQRACGRWKQAGPRRDSSSQSFPPEAV